MSFLDGLWNADSEAERRKGKRHRLRDIEVSEVSLVDRAANKRKFLVTKREGAMTKKRKVSKGFGNGLIDLDGDTDFGTDPGHLKNEVRKGEAIPTPVKTVVQRALTEATERLMGVVQSVRRAEESTERAPRPLPESIGKEIMAVGALLQGVLRSYPSPVESDEDEKKEKDEEKEDTEKSMSSSARKAILDTLGGINKRIIALHALLKQEEEEEEDDKEEMEEKDKSDDSEKDDDEEKDASGEEKAEDDEEEEEEKTDTEKSAMIAKELQGLALALGGALARVPTAKAVALVEIDVPADTIEKDEDGLVLHPATKKALSSGLEDALDALSTSLRNLNRIDTAKSDEVPQGYSLPESITQGAERAGSALLSMGMEYGTIASGAAHDLDASLRAAQKATEDAKADEDEDDKEDDADKAVADKAKKGKKIEPDMAETIKDAMAAALAPINERLDTIESGVKKNAKSVKKAMNAKSAGNAVPAGTKVEKSDDDSLDAGIDLNRMSPAKVKELKEQGLWF